MQTVLSNEYLRVTIASQGAQIISVKTANNRECMWTAEKELWDYHAPVLFPWTGRIKNKTFTKDGVLFKADIHGFIRDEQFVCTEQSATSARFQKNSDDSTRCRFPYDFCFTQNFTLNGNTLRQTVSVTNTGKETMPFGLGYHPGFLCPFEKGKEAKDYSLFFDKVQKNAKCVVITQDGFATEKLNDFMTGESSIQLSDTFFSENSVCLTGLDSASVVLCETSSNAHLPKERQNAVCSSALQAIEVGLSGFPFLLVWTAKSEKMRFLCIEPWHTLPDFAEADAEWKKKKNLLHLAAGKTFSSTLLLTFHTK